MARKQTWSWNVGSVAGIAVRVHATLLILLAWVLLAHVFGGATLERALAGVAFTAIVFAIIVVHELAHALVARRFGCKTREILLLPIGGVAQMEQLPERPVQELLVAIAGPAVNLVFAGLLAIGIAGAGGSLDPEAVLTTDGSFATQLLWVNVGLAVFNLLPAFPMDGGRVFRALISIWLGRDRATQVASAVGRVLGVVFVIAGLAFSLTLAIVGAFVWLAARQESANLELRTLLAGVPVRVAMISPPVVIDARESVEHAADQILRSGQRELIVVDDTRLIGLVTVAELAAALEEPPGLPVGALARRIPTVGPDDLLEVVLHTVERAGGAFVLEREDLVGLLTPEQLAIYAAFHPRRPLSRRPPVAAPRPVVIRP